MVTAAQPSALDGPPTREQIRDAAAGWMLDGFPCFVRPMYLDRERPGKVVKGGYANCPDCVAGAHDPGGCVCDGLLCHGVYAATLDLDRFTQMLDKAVGLSWGGSTVALSVRVPEGFCVIDVDAHPGGEDGVAHMNRLIEQSNDGRGSILWTMWCTEHSRHDCDPCEHPQMGNRVIESAGGGAHFYFRVPVGMVLPKELLPAVEVKGPGSNLVVPPAVTPAGAAYRAAHPGFPRPLPPIVDAPPRLLGLLHTRVTLDEVGKSMRNEHRAAYEVTGFTQPSSPWATTRDNPDPAGLVLDRLRERERGCSSKARTGGSLNAPHTRTTARVWMCAKSRTGCSCIASAGPPATRSKWWTRWA